MLGPDEVALMRRLMAETPASAAWSGYKLNHLFRYSAGSHVSKEASEFSQQFSVGELSFFG